MTTASSRSAASAQRSKNVLVPETVTAHKQRLAKAGFSHSAVWLRYFNFVSIVAIK